MRQVGYLQELYRDARSTKHFKKTLKYTVGAETQHQNQDKPASKFGSRRRFFWTAYFMVCQAVGMTVSNELGKDIKSTGHDLHL